MKFDAMFKTVALAAACAILGPAAWAAAPAPAFNMAQTISDGAQRTTLAFSGLAMMTGNLEAQSFFPPGKVADYTGFQYLRDNDPDGMGHNTSFLTRVANNVIFILNDSQFAQLKTLAAAQMGQVDLYGYKRYPLMKAFRRLMDGDIPAGSAGLNLAAVKKASRELYLIDGQISFDRAVLYASLVRSLDATQKAYLDAMKGKGWNSWPDITDAQIRTRMSGLPQGTGVAVMTYASDLFSWYAGSLEADVYFCPERHGTYYGGFYIKDAPAIGHEGYSINEQLTATAGAALSDSAKGYVTPAQAAVMSSLVDTQRNNLYASATASIVSVRTEIATLLRSLLSTSTSAAVVQSRVLELSGVYGDLDGENNHAYATVFAQVYKTLSAEQKAKLAALRKSIMSGTYADGTAFDYSVATTPFLYSGVITDLSLLAPYIANTDYLFLDAGSATGALTASPAALAFGGQSMNTTSPAMTLRLSNATASAVTVSALTGSTYFAVSHNCASVAAGASCTASVTFTPSAQGSLAGTLTIVTNAGTQTIALSGTGEKSLVTHFYRSILRRAPEAAGKSYWDAEAARVVSLGANVNEVWFALAGTFYASAEYTAQNRDHAGFVTDLFSTFFNRAPDAAGLAYWSGQLAQGMPREVVLASFMFSPEFATFTQAIFGTAGTRKEADAVVDFYRGLLARLPDDAGFRYWVNRFRTAQCQGGAAVNAAVEGISGQFAQSGEYAARNRTNAQYVGDLYNAFLRRGGDLAGVQFWIDQLASGARSRDAVRQQFVASREYGARVGAILAEGCLP